MHFGVVVMEPLKIVGWLGNKGWAHIQVKTKDHISFVLLDFKNIIGRTLQVASNLMPICFKGALFH